MPGGARFDHHAVRVPRSAVGTVVHDPARGVLLLWRHRFITDSWGWEVPAGGVDHGEELPVAAARSDPSESERVAWAPTARVRELVRAGEVRDGMSLTAQTWWLAFVAR